MLSDTAKTFLFAFLMCVFCSVSLTMAKVILKDRQDKNVVIDQQKNILKAFGLVDTSIKYSGTDIETLYNKHVATYYVNPNGQVISEETALPIYIIGNPENIQKYAIPFKAYGLWSYIYGYIALEGDGNTVAGFTVYQHKETPGLGGECEKPWFQDQFVGKKITNSLGKFVSVGVVKGKVKDSVPPSKHDFFVDGMSGATITSKGIERDLKVQLKSYEILSRRLRG